MFLRGRVDEGRNAYEQALDALGTEPGWGINGMRAYLVSDWAVAEVAFGDCNFSAAHVQQFIGFVTQPQVPTPTKAGLVAALRSQLSQQTRCATPEALIALH